MVEMRLDLDWNLPSEKIPSHCNLQRRMYTNPIWGTYNNVGIKISKLILKLQPIFPLEFQGVSLEYAGIKKYASVEEGKVSNDSDRFDIDLNLIGYYEDKWFVHIDQRCEIQTGMVDLPRLLKDDTVIVEGVQKVLVVQLTTPSGLCIEISEENKSTELVLSQTLTMELNNLGVTMTKGGCSAGLLDVLSSLMTKHSHVLRRVLGVTTLAYFKGVWRDLVYRPTKHKNQRFGIRRLLRHRKDLTGVTQRKNMVLVFGKKFNMGRITGWEGGLTRLDLSRARSDFSIMNVVMGSSNVNLISTFMCRDIVSCVGITKEDISSVDLTFVGRCQLDGLVGSSWCHGLDLLTKRDLLEMLRKDIGSGGKWDITCSSVRILKGVGDIVIGIIDKNMSDVFDIIGSRLWQECFVRDKLTWIYNKTMVEVRRVFDSSGMCQFLDQVNALSELSHKNRLTYIGEGSVTVQTAELVTRDVNKWYFGKVCPIESPEGQNVGLVLALAVNASVDVNGYITTAYCKVYNGRISNGVVYLNYFEAKHHSVAIPSKHGLSEHTICMNSDRVKVVPAKHITLSMTSCSQVFSYAVCLIPFLGHNDPTRALMAANMLKQAIPLALPQSPLIGTGVEAMAMEASGQNVKTRSGGIVSNVDSKGITVYDPSKGGYHVYSLSRPMKTNQEMLCRLRSVVNPGQILKSGSVIAECQSSCDGEMSLGVNLLAAFMCWRGLNYEDSILLSEGVISKGVFNSFHVLDVEVKVLETEHGGEWLTNRPVKASERDCQHLEANGIAREGCVLKEDDILVGKLSPLVDDVKLKQKLDGDGKINGNGLSSKEKDRLVKDTSFRVPIGISYAMVLEVDRDVDSDVSNRQDGSYKEYLYRWSVVTKVYIRRCCRLLQQAVLSMGEGLEELSSTPSDKHIQNGMELLRIKYIRCLERMESSLFEGFGKRLTGNTDVIDSDVNEVINIRLLVKRSIKVGDKVCGRHGNKGVISKIVPKEDMPFMADGTPIDIVLSPLGVPSRMNIGQILEANFGLISYKLGLEFKQILDLYHWSNNEELLRSVVPKLKEIYPSIKIFTKDMILMLISELSKGVKISCSNFGFDVKSNTKWLADRLGLQRWDGQVQLYDGRTGYPFDKKTTVGIVYILKLNHLVDNKIRYRSIGPYSDVTQQPSKGKMHKGGQRLGEMEVWALQSYGAAFVTNEALTAKCDDITARNKLHANMLSGTPVLLSYRNEGVLSMLKVLFAMGIDVNQDVE
ncbi:DNA-directed RNA polymerase subunit beta [Candidatus Hodgkinia cicadicola]|nr:DNA-directed RNA polymerase subunit beta [Candidatus Hodgkinia cicadicola]